MLKSTVYLFNASGFYSGYLVTDREPELFGGTLLEPMNYNVELEIPKWNGEAWQLQLLDVQQ